jgi:hypothetical protein
MSWRDWRGFADRGPVVGGDGAADAEGAVVHPIHVSQVYPGRRLRSKGDGAAPEDRPRERLHCWLDAEALRDSGATGITEGVLDRVVSEAILEVLSWRSGAVARLMSERHTQP